MSESEAAAVSGLTGEQPPLPPGTEALAGLVPATVCGMPPTAQVFFAVINGNGTIARGCQVVSAFRFSTGTYQVIFTHDLTGSAYLGTIGIPNPSVSPPGIIVVAPRAGAPNGVFVQTFNPAGVLADLSFHLGILS